MTLIEGKVSPIIELTYAGAVVGSSPISVIIDRNPIQIDDIESQAEWPAITERVSNAETQAIAAKNSVEGLDRKIENETSRATARENELETKIAHANITDVQVNGESVVKDKIAQVDLTEYAKSSDLTSYVLKSGDTMTGTLNVPAINSTNTSTAVSINTGTNASSYFQARKFRGQGDANTYNHAVDFGCVGHDRIDFYEYGGVFNFWANRSTSKLEGDGNRVASLQSGKILERGNTLTYPGKSGTFALTSDIDEIFVKTSSATEPSE